MVEIQPFHPDIARINRIEASNIVGAVQTDPLTADRLAKGIGRLGNQIFGGALCPCRLWHCDSRPHRQEPKIFHHSSAGRLCGPVRCNQKLDIAFWPFDRAWRDAFYDPALFGQPVIDFRTDT